VVAPAAVTTGETEAESVAKQAQAVASQPMMIYITSDDPTDKDTRKLESVVFKNEKVGIGSKFFDCIKVSSGDALVDRLLKDAGRATPRLVFLNRQYEVKDVLENSELSGGKLLRAMKNVASDEYVTSFETMIRDYIKLLNELDRLESKKAQLEDQRRRLAEKPNKSREKKVARDEEEYKAEMEDWSQKEAKVKELRKKGEDKAEA
jgi:hypothetical protein